MSTLVQFLDRLFSEGRVSFRERPVPTREGREAAVPLLEKAFEEDVLDLSGPPPTFSPIVATAAAEWTQMACWFLVSRDEPVEQLDRLLKPPRRSSRTGDHLSADLTYRYLPLVHRRAKALAADDLLTARLAEVLRDWPLSGVLSDVSEPPRQSVNWSDEPAMAMLYAERLARREKPGWAPPTGTRAWEVLELVLDRLGNRHSILLRGPTAGGRPVVAAAGGLDRD